MTLAASILIWTLLVLTTMAAIALAQWRHPERYATTPSALRLAEARIEKRGE